MEITLYTAKWCPKCRDITQIVEKTSLQHKSITLDDNPEDLSTLREHTGFTNVPAITIGGNTLLGYFPKQLSIILKTDFEARNHPAHPLAKPPPSSQQRNRS